MKDAVVAVNAQPADLNGVPSTRKCFVATVIGASNCGKSSFLRSFVEAPYIESDERHPTSCIKAIREKDPKKKD